MHELRAIGAGGHGNLDPGPCLIAVLPMRGEDDGVAQAVGLAEPQTVVETFHRRTLADIHIVILRRRDSGSIAVISGQCRDTQRLVAVLLKDAEKPYRRCREQPVDGHLNVRAHMTRELPRGRNQLIPRNAGEMPCQRLAGIVELLVADDFGQLARDLVPAVIANQRLHAFQWKRGLGGKRAAELATVIFTALRNRLASDQERMTRGTDVLSSSLKHLVCNVARIAPAHRSSVSVDCFGEFKGVGDRLLEHRMQNFNHEFHRRIVVVVKDYLEMAGLGLNIGHGISPPDW